MELKDRVESVYKKRCGFRYNHPTWDLKLWNKSAQEIKDYLLNKFNNTLDEIEYYSCMVLLYRTIPNKTLLIEFKDSQQYQEAYNHTHEHKTVKDIKGNITEMKTIKGSSINIVGGGN